MSRRERRPAVAALTDAKHPPYWQNIRMQDSAFVQQLEINLSQVKTQIAATNKALKQANIDHRLAPPQPTTCCGRGCNGCVWEGWYAAVHYWQEQADQLLVSNAP